MSDSAALRSASFHAFAELCERLAATSSRLERARLVADYLRGLRAQEAEEAVRWLVGRTGAEREGRRLALSGRAVWEALATIGGTGTAHDWAGAEDFGDLVYRLLSPLGRPTGGLSISEVAAGFRTIAETSGAGSRRARVAVLADLFRRASPLEAKYLAKIVVGEMRHGVQEGIVLEAIAVLCGSTAEEVRRAHQAIGDLGMVARTAHEAGRSALRSAAVQLFRPVKPMLAQSAADVAEAFAAMDSRLALEWKLDGARVQVHKDGQTVRLFSRRLQEITPSLPEIVASVARDAGAGKAIFEGEVIPVTTGADGERPLPFQELLRRFRRTRSVAETAALVPVRLYLFDLLWLDGESLLDSAAATRWAALQAARGEVRCVGRLLARTVLEGQAFYEAALAAGFEGVMAKALDAPYTPGMRGAGWLKIKKVVTLDLVIIAADWGYGRRHGWLSNYHLAARDPATGRFVPVGKTFKGLTDEQFRTMTARLLALEVDRRGGTVVVRPEVVVEVGFTDVQRSPQYACGMALRFARIVRIRDDKRAADADTVETLRALFERAHRGGACRPGGR